MRLPTIGQTTVEALSTCEAAPGFGNGRVTGNGSAPSCETARMMSKPRRGIEAAPKAGMALEALREQASVAERAMRDRLQERGP